MHDLGVVDLRLAGNNIRDAGAVAIAGVLSRDAREFARVDLSRNAIGDNGAGVAWALSWFTPVLVLVIFGLPDIVNLFAYVDSIEMRRSQEAVDMVHREMQLKQALREYPSSRTSDGVSRQRAGRVGASR